MRDEIASEIVSSAGALAFAYAIVQRSRLGRIGDDAAGRHLWNAYQFGVMRHYQLCQYTKFEAHRGAHALLDGATEYVCCSNREGHGTF